MLHNQTIYHRVTTEQIITSDQHEPTELNTIGGTKEEVEFKAFSQTY